MGSSFRYKCLPSHAKWMKEQLWECREDIGVYSRTSAYEFEQYGEYVGAPRRVLDLGCGLGRVSVYLNVRLQDPETEYILADVAGESGALEGWDLPRGCYSDFKATTQFVTLNGLKNFRTFDLGSGDWSAIGDVDLVISCCAVGMHFPIEGVLPHLLRVATADCTMIFGTRRRDLYGPSSFREEFAVTRYLEQPLVKPYPQQDWLILRNPRG